MLAYMLANIDPVAFQIGPLAVRWYALAYIAGTLLGWRYIRWLNRGVLRVTPRETADDLIIWSTLGIIVGGRLGYVYFYMPVYYFENPLEILFIWEGGMSFHGGLLGLATALVVFARRHAIYILPLGDLVACAAPIGLFLGRIANFVNGELFGRPTDVPWAVVFPAGGFIPRHPSQLYEALLEGLVLFILLLATSRIEAVRIRPGLLLGLFLAGYGVARSVAELYREPDAFLGVLAFGLTMGQLLSLPMIAAGLAILGYALYRGPRRILHVPSQEPSRKSGRLA